MKYTHSENKTYRGTTGYVPKTWLESEFDDPTLIMKDHYDNDLYIYDADTCGDESIIFFFENGEAYELYHDWWISYDPEWEMHNSFTIEKIDLNKVPDWMKKERDWL